MAEEDVHDGDAPRRAQALLARVERLLSHLLLLPQAMNELLHVSQGALTHAGVVARDALLLAHACDCAAHLLLRQLHL